MRGCLWLCRLPRFSSCRGPRIRSCVHLVDWYERVSLAVVEVYEVFSVIEYAGRTVDSPVVVIPFVCVVGGCFFFVCSLAASALDFFSLGVEDAVSLSGDVEFHNKSPARIPTSFGVGGVRRVSTPRTFAIVVLRICH